MLPLLTSDLPATSVFPIEVLSLIVSSSDPSTLGSVALLSRRILRLVDKQRYSILRFHAAKDIFLWRVLVNRPSVASCVKQLVIDWIPTPEKETPFHFFPAFEKLLSNALSQATNLSSIRIQRNPPFKLGLLSSCPQIQELRLETDAPPELAAFLETQHHLSTVYIPPPVPRPLLRSFLESFGVGNSRVTSLTLSVASIDFGVLGEITLGMKQLKELHICGPFILDPYQSVS